MGRAFSEHGKGVAAGVVTWLLIYAVSCVYLALRFPDEGLRGSFGGCVVAPAHLAPAPPTSDGFAAVVENPYGLGTCYRPPRWSNPVLELLAFVLSGAVAALGPRMVAWRGAVVGMVGGGVLAVCGQIVGPFIFKPLDFAAFFAVGCAIFGLVGYAGGGLAKLVAWARTRAA